MLTSLFHIVRWKKMEYESELSLLSSKFTQDYPPAVYPELLHKHGRPYTCLLIESHDDYFICVPFRSSIGHKNAFLFTDTVRSKKTKSGLDYSKIAIIKDTNYFDSNTAAIVDQDKYAEEFAVADSFLPLTYVLIHS